MCALTVFQSIENHYLGPGPQTSSLPWPRGQQHTFEVSQILVFFFGRRRSTLMGVLLLKFRNRVHYVLMAPCSSLGRLRVSAGRHVAMVPVSGCRLVVL